MTKALTAIIQATDKATAMHLCRALESDVRVRVTSIVRTPERVYEEVTKQQPSIVVLTLDAQPQATWELGKKLREDAPNTAIICAAPHASPDLILDTLRNGAHEFLRLPLRPAEVSTVFDRIVETHQVQKQQDNQKRGRVIAVFSPKGGCGTSFLATNLAVGINAPTALLDLNLQASSLDLYCGVKPRFSWLDLIENHARLDEQMLASSLTQITDQMSLLAAPAKTEEAEGITPEQMHDVIFALRSRFDYVVLDVMHTFDALTLSALDIADEILLVIGLDIVTVRAAQRALTIFQRLEYPRDKVKLVLNRSNQQSELSVREIEKALAQPIACTISDDYRTVVTSLNVGQPLMAETNHGPLGQELHNLLVTCELPNRGELNSSKRGLLDILLRRNTSNLNNNGVQRSTQPLTSLKPSRTKPLLLPPSELDEPHPGVAPPQAPRERNPRQDESQVIKTY